MEEEIQKLKYMIIDDEVDLADSNHELLLNIGATKIDVFYNSVIAWEALCLRVNTDSEIDILLLDHLMPEMSGEALLKKLRADRRFDKLIVVMVTAQIGVKESLVIGATDYLAKPYGIEVFKRKIKAVIRMKNQKLRNVNFLPVRCSTLALDEKLPFTCFHSEYQLYRLLMQQGETVEQKHLDILKRFGVKRLYIEDEDESKYQGYLDLRLKDLINNEKINVDDKSQFLTDFGVYALKNALHDPGKEDVEKLDALSLHMENFFSKSKDKSLRSFFCSDEGDDIYKHSLRVASLVMLIIQKIVEIEKNPKHPKYSLIKPFSGTFKERADDHQFKVMMDSAYFHDISNKKEDEKAGEHAVRSSEKILEIPYGTDRVSKIVLQHEEFCDGSGHPSSLNRSQMSNHAKILSLANYYDNEVVKKGLDKMQALRLLKENKNKFMSQLIEILKLVL